MSTHYKVLRSLFEAATISKHTVQYFTTVAILVHCFPSSILLSVNQCVRLSTVLSYTGWLMVSSPLIHRRKKISTEQMTLSNMGLLLLLQRTHLFGFVFVDLQGSTPSTSEKLSAGYLLCHMLNSQMSWFTLDLVLWTVFGLFCTLSVCILSNSLTPLYHTVDLRLMEL